MAKTKKRALSSATIKPLYEDVESMPWNDIETDFRSWKKGGAAPDPLFSSSDREEIFLCTEVYSKELSWQSGGVISKDIDDLRNIIANCTNDLCEALEKYLKPKKDPPIRNQGTALDALSMMFGNGENDFHREIDKLYTAAQKIKLCLEQEAYFEPEETQRSPESAPLEKFIESVLSGAKKGQSRSSTQNFNTPDAYEFKRWGISVGPQSKGFRVFVNAILGTEHTPHQIRAAFARARKDGAETLGEVIKRIRDKGV